MNKTFILPCHSSDSEVTTDLDFASLSVEPADIARLQMYREVRDTVDIQLSTRSWDGKAEVVFFNYWVDYYPFYSRDAAYDYEEGSLLDRLDQALADSRIIEVQLEDFTALNLPKQRTDMDEIHIAHDGVYWTCHPRHMDVTVRTEILSWDLLFPNEENANA